MSAVGSDTPIAPVTPPVSETAEGRRTHRRWFQVGLGDLAVWILGIAIVAGLARRWLARWAGADWASWPFDSRVPGLFVLVLSVALALRLAGQMIRLGWGQAESRGTGPEASRPRWAAAIGWRGFALALPVGMMTEVVGGWNSPQFSIYTNIAVTPRDQRWDDALPLYGVLVILGLSIGMRPPAARTRGRARWSGLFTLAAGVVGIGFAASTMLFPHFVLVAMEAVSDAQRVFALQDLGLAHLQVMVPLEAVPDALGRQAIGRPSLALRIGQAGWPAAIAVVATLATAAWISKDLRRAASDAGQRPLSRRSLIYRLATFTMMVTCAYHLLRTTIPHIHEWFLLGVRILLGPRELAVLVLGFGVFSAGIVARAIGRADEVADRLAPPGPWGWLGRLAAGLFLLALILTSVERILAPWGYPPDFLPRRLVGEVPADALTWAMRHWDEIWSPPMPLVFWLPALLWASVEALRRCGPRASDRATAFDAVFVSAARSRRFLGLWAALTTLCLCALPTLFVAGLVVYQYRLGRPG
jgi:hypothetical protein